MEEFDRLNEADADRAVYISKLWLRGMFEVYLNRTVAYPVLDWHLKMPKFHNSDPLHVGDPPPDAKPWRSHVFCEHDGLNMNANNRVRITDMVS